MSLGLLAALLVIGLGVALVIGLGRGRVRALEEAGFSRCGEVPPEVRAAAEELLGSRISLAWSRPDAAAGVRATGATGASWLLEIEGYGSDDPDLHLLLYRLPADAAGTAMLVRRAAARLPERLRRAQAGLWGRVDAAGDELEDAVAGTDWRVFVDPGAPPSAAVADGLVRVAHRDLPAAVIGVAAARGFLAVWTAGRALPLLAAGPAASEAFAATEAASS